VQLEFNTLVSLVDRILNQQKVERVRAEAARLQLERERKEAQEAESRALATTAKQKAIEPPPISEKGSMVHQPTPTPPVVVPQPKENPRQSVLGTFNNFRQKLVRGSGISERGNESETKSLLGPPGDGGSALTPSPRVPSPSGQVTSQDNIGKSSVVCLEGCSNFLDHSQRITFVWQLLHAARRASHCSAIANR
jgi:hypothetical protein